MSFTGKGGRGHKAPYSTIHYRIPTLIKPTVEKLAYKFKEVVYDHLGVENLLERVNQAIDSNTKKDSEQIEFLKMRVENLEDMVEYFRVKNRNTISLIEQALAVKGNKAGEVKSFIKQAYHELAEEEYK